MRSCILVDFDGTLIDGDIERMFIKFLMSKSIVRWKLLLMSMITLPINVFLNLFDRPSILKSWTYVLGDDRKKYIDEFIKCKSNDIKIKNDVWDMLYRKDSDVIILSGSFSELIEAYLREINKFYIFNKIIGCDVELNNFIIKRHPFGKGKVAYVDINKYNIGIANENRDKYYMNLCDEKIFV